MEVEPQFLWLLDGVLPGVDQCLKSVKVTARPEAQEKGLTGISRGPRASGSICSQSMP
jgi:hypothetical protein